MIETTTGSITEATTADIIPLPGIGTHDDDITAGDPWDNTWDDLAELHKLRRLLILALIEALEKPNPKASVLNVARAFLHDQGFDNQEPPQDAGLSHIAAAVMSMREGGMDFPFPTFAPPDDTADF